MSKYTLKNRLNDNKKDIIKDSCIFAGGALVTIAGVFGIIHFGKELIDFYQSGETLTFATRFAADWEEAKVGFAAIPSIIGGMVSYNSGKKLKDDISYRKVLKKELKEERTYKK